MIYENIKCDVHYATKLSDKKYRQHLYSQYVWNICEIMSECQFVISTLIADGLAWLNAGIEMANYECRISALQRRHNGRHSISNH